MRNVHVHVHYADADKFRVGQRVRVESSGSSLVHLSGMRGTVEIVGGRQCFVHLENGFSEWIPNTALRSA